MCRPSREDVRSIVHLSRRHENSSCREPWESSHRRRGSFIASSHTDAKNYLEVIAISWAQSLEAYVRGNPGRGKRQTSGAPTEPTHLE